MNAKAPIAILALALGLSACRQPSPLPDPEAHARAPHDAHGPPLELNHGKKWIVPSPMMEQVRTIEKAVRDLDAAPTKNHAALAAAIREHLGQLVTKCTMEGKAHEELHKWLMPFLGLSEAYFKATDPSVQEKKFREVQQSLAVFNEYFE
jgi:hypothetical protein